MISQSEGRASNPRVDRAVAGLVTITVGHGGLELCGDWIVEQRSIRLCRRLPKSDPKLPYQARGSLEDRHPSRLDWHGGSGSMGWFLDRMFRNTGDLNVCRAMG